jgi:hypothetical protein
LYDRQLLTERSSFYRNFKNGWRGAATEGREYAASEFCHNNKTNVKIRKVNNFILTKSIRKAKEK